MHNQIEPRGLRGDLRRGQTVRLFCLGIVLGMVPPRR